MIFMAENQVVVCSCPKDVEDDEEWSWPMFLYGCLAAGGGLLLLAILVKLTCCRKKTYSSDFEMGDYVHDDI